MSGQLWESRFSELMNREGEQEEKGHRRGMRRERREQEGRGHKGRAQKWEEVWRKIIS